MNVIFLDFDGVINTFNRNLAPIEEENAPEERVKILGEICKKYDCKVVIEASAKDAIDEETMEIDEGFMGAMEQGMPPISGLGFGIDRLLMIIYNQSSIRDVVLFPTMKDVKPIQNEE
jgi:aspartyl/asparaginyl-tRNA synthetase